MIGAGRYIFGAIIQHLKFLLSQLFIGFPKPTNVESAIVIILWRDRRIMRNNGLLLS
ncbi:hypothetical protein D3C73_774840 [compost metagenome]